MMIKSKPLLLIDVHNLAWRAFHSTGMLSFQDNPTGVLFGVLREVNRLQFEWAPKAMAFCFDTPTSQRQKDCPTYKANRGNPHDDPDLIEARLKVRLQVIQLRKVILPAIGFRNFFLAKGYEADDLIASICSQYKKRTILIVSNDHDMLQLLGENVSIWNAHKHKITTAQSFRDEWGISPLQWVEVKALAGCLSDNVHGVPGVGEKTAAKFMRGQLKPNSKAYNAIVTNNDLWERNIRLVRLPYPGTPSFEVFPDATTPKTWQSELTKLGIRSF